MLGRALDSVFTQSLRADEVIVVDDGSDDSTANWLRTEYPDVQLIENPSNRGVSYSRNRGIEAATGDWIALLDSDDAWMPEKLKAQVDAVGDRDEISLCHTDEIWIRRGVRVNPHDKHKKLGGYIFAHCLPRCVVSPSSVLIRRTLFDEVGTFDENLPACEDYDMWLRICAVQPVLFVPDAHLVKYGGHDDQLSTRHWGMDRFRVYSLEKLIRSGNLEDSQLVLARNELLRKLNILHDGALKREKHEDSKRWQSKIRQYEP